jgi:hypothetical protein
MAIRPRVVAIMRRLKSDFQAARRTGDNMFTAEPIARPGGPHRGDATGIGGSGALRYSMTSSAVANSV